MYIRRTIRIRPENKLSRNLVDFQLFRRLSGKIQIKFPQNNKIHKKFPGGGIHFK